MFTRKPEPIWFPDHGILPQTIKALTISQPWANLVANGEKLIENRIWETPHRGWLAIHAGSGAQYLSRSQLQQYPTQKVLAIARLVGCWSREAIESESFLSIKMPESQRPFVEGPFCWFLEIVARVEPYPIPGKQGLWNLSTFGLRVLKAPPPLPVPDHPLRPSPPAAATPDPATVDRQRRLFG